MHSRYTWIRWGRRKRKEEKKKKKKKKKEFILYICLFTETKWQTFRGIPGFYSTSGAVDYTAVIFCAHLVAVKCEVFTTTSTREIQLCARPATQLTCSSLLRQISHASPLRMNENLSKRGLLPCWVSLTAHAWSYERIVNVRPRQNLHVWFMLPREL